MVDEGIGINVGEIAMTGSAKSGSVEGRLEIVDVALQIVCLGCGDLFLFGIDVGQTLPAAGVESGSPGSRRSFLMMYPPVTSGGALSMGWIRVIATRFGSRLIFSIKT